MQEKPVCVANRGVAQSGEHAPQPGAVGFRALADPHGGEIRRDLQAVQVESSVACLARFLEEGGSRKLQLRQHGALWSLAAGASIKACVRELGKLYDRALRYHPVSLAIALTSGRNGATSDESAELLA